MKISHKLPQYNTIRKTFKDVMGVPGLYCVTRYNGGMGWSGVLLITGTGRNFIIDSGRFKIADGDDLWAEGLEFTLYGGEICLSN